MKASLAVFILAALLATGACLQCEVCEGPGTNCTGDLETCAAGLDSCGITLTESTLAGMKLQMIAKGCVTSGSCKVGPFTMNFGNGVTMKVITACCVGVACRTTTVTAPPADPNPSGRSCPACIAVLFAKCNEEIIDCTGAETRCVEVAGTTTIDNVISQRKLSEETRLGWVTFHISLLWQLHQLIDSSKRSSEVPMARYELLSDRG
ncbi:phospholipase A2 inhibitor NAI-like [Natator depressus]|uniref:phospholipase A2 inhibitor NAI-like n=1 Tax=Natator depressus TaxID=27790 RepID=UPI003EBBF6C5